MLTLWSIFGEVSDKSKSYPLRTFRVARCPVLNRTVQFWGDLSGWKFQLEQDTDIQIYVYRSRPSIFGSRAEFGNRSRVSSFSTCRPGNPTYIGLGNLRLGWISVDDVLGFGLRWVGKFVGWIVSGGTKWTRVHLWTHIARRRRMHAEHCVDKETLSFTYVTYYLRELLSSELTYLLISKKRWTRNARHVLCTSAFIIRINFHEQTARLNVCLWIWRKNRLKNNGEHFMLQACHAINCVYKKNYAKWFRQYFLKITSAWILNMPKLCSNDTVVNVT